MHPIEHLRYVTRDDSPDGLYVAEAAAEGLAGMAVMDPVGLVPACRRLIQHHLTSGPVWWLSARVLGGEDPRIAARQASDELAEDRTARHLAASLPDSASALVIGWPAVTGQALRRRGDIEVLVVDSNLEGSTFVRRIEDSGGEAILVPEGGAGAAAASAGLVIIEAFAAGPSGLLAAPASLSSAAVAAHLGTPVWAVAGVGRVLPDRLWHSLLREFDAEGSEPWDRAAELVPASLLSHAVGPDGECSVEELLACATCPPAPELLRITG